MSIRIALLKDVTRSLRSMSKRSKVLLGGPFGLSGRYGIASLVDEHAGLDQVIYFVFAYEGGAVISHGYSVDKALASARSFLAETPADVVREYLAEMAADQAAPSIASERPERPSSVPAIPKRRRLVFEASGGRCHYCGTGLDIEGRWHIDHKMPRALFGGSEQSNLVAACISCNHKKRDKTDLEFLAQLEQHEGARA
jgi:hypothetical protein